MKTARGDSYICFWHWEVLVLLPSVVTSMPSYSLVEKGECKPQLVWSLTVCCCHAQCPAQYNCQFCTSADCGLCEVTLLSWGATSWLQSLPSAPTLPLLYCLVIVLMSLIHFIATAVWFEYAILQPWLFKYSSRVQYCVIKFKSLYIEWCNCCGHFVLLTFETDRMTLNSYSVCCNAETNVVSDKQVC